MVRKKTNHLVCEFLESIDRKMLVEYQDIIRDFIKGHQGIYALYKGDELYYVGLATNLRGRLKAHLRDRHKNSWNRFSVYLVIENKHVKELESLFLRILMPKGNAQKGKFPKAVNLKTRLVSEIRRRQKEELEVLTGKRRKVTRKKSKRTLAKRISSETSLGPYINKAFKIRQTYKGKVYTANVRKSGWIYFRGYLYRSPSTLGKEITGRSNNGWHFWNYERAPGQWVKLKELKQ
eukprot:COSAG01_NODE_46_length_32080_cov_716.589319_10_plen_235_part_00